MTRGKSAAGEDGLTSGLPLPRWRVRLWTDFNKTFGNDESRRDRAENMARFAGAMEKSLANKCAHYEPSVVQANRDSEPQLRFELTVPALSAEEASKTARYWIGRASQAKRTYTMGDRRRDVPVMLILPFGSCDVESA